MKLVREILRSELGHALSMALVLLLMGGLFVVPVLLLVTTSLKANMMAEENTSELYAADAGVEYGVWTLKYDEEFVLPVEGETPLPLYLPEPTMNGIAVQVTLSNEGVDGYKITSAAGGTTIESYVSLTSSLAWLLDNAVSSPGTVDLKNDSVVTGGVVSSEEPTGQGTYDSWDDYDGGGYSWPTAEQISPFYWEQVKDLSPESDPWDIDVSSGTMDEPYPIGPLGSALAPGNLNISGGGVARLEGTVYVVGNLTVFNSCTIDLNGQTVYVEGNIEFKSGCTFVGSGCIIAEGSIDFKTNGDTDPDGFLFLMSISGQVTLHNADSIYGAVAGTSEVELKNGCALTLTAQPEGGLNFPETSGSGATGGGQVEMLSYTINPP